MLFRAIFWIGLVSLLMPHEPDLGFGRPHSGGFLPASLAGLAAESAKAPGACEDNKTACMAGLSILDGMQSLAVRSLGEVKAEIEQSQRERFVQRHAM